MYRTGSNRDIVLVLKPDMAHSLGVAVRNPALYKINNRISFPSKEVSQSFPKTIYEDSDPE